MDKMDKNELWVKFRRGLRFLYIAIWHIHLYLLLNNGGNRKH
jgi:hypothetical protein